MQDNRDRSNGHPGDVLSGLTYSRCRGSPAQTAVKLQDGSVWLAASHPLTPSTLQTLAELGPIKHIVMVRRRENFSFGLPSRTRSSSRSPPVV